MHKTKYFKYLCFLLNESFMDAIDSLLKKLKFNHFLNF